MTTARDVMNRGAQTLRQDETLLDAAKQMKRLGIGSLPVLDGEGSIVGMVTDRDIVVRCIADGADAARTSAGSITDGAVATVEANDPIADVLATMRERQVKRVPVLDGGELVGMISESDIVAELSEGQVADFAQGVYKKD